MMGAYRKPEVPLSLEERVEALEDRIMPKLNAEARQRWVQRYGTWIFWVSFLSILGAIGVGATWALLARNRAIAEAEQHRCEDICSINSLQFMWIDEDSVYGHAGCVCGHRGLDGGVLRSFEFENGNARPNYNGSL